ncbi:23S rRNA (guanosine2251-2'-O)-methyltransferase [Tepidamorphus gemmatus]|uniref:23S rRNA (Guanosine2251-2'-O)-methyltransferase n=1 Tax=Tepidamorphus gemmatus TaxID=747076 RepID=A0A4R3M0K9_9HYPH|nr:RNA methyltransferase [Tepidamorphus gemmatus]TCT06522.1 23S rRNA (guanosine2251-2'-O)-methyltransferase [Tepidamorphus gemmatus]
MFGLHPVAAAFANPARNRHRLLATANALRRLAEMGVVPDVEVEETTTAAIGRLLGNDAVHQGCLLYCEPLAEPDIGDLAAARRLLVLDQVTDPHNVGAVLRSAAAFAADAVVVTERHSPRETAVLAKSAAGALDMVPVVRVRNLSKALEELAAAGVLTVGLDAGADAPLEMVPIAEPFALVLGAEGKGLRQKTRETCARLARIDMPGAMPSLNVSNAAALALYIADRAIAARRSEI